MLYYEHDESILSRSPLGYRQPANICTYIFSEFYSPIKWFSLNIYQGINISRTQFLLCSFFFSTFDQTMVSNQAHVHISQPASPLN